MAQSACRNYHYAGFLQYTVILMSSPAHVKSREFYLSPYCGGLFDYRSTLRPTLAD